MFNKQKFFSLLILTTLASLFKIVVGCSKLVVRFIPIELTRMKRFFLSRHIDDPKTTVSKRAQIDEDTVVMGHVIINTSSTVDHDCIIQDFAHISPNATLSGGVTIGRGTHVGSGAVIIPNITIGAGAVIIRDVVDNATVVGNPGRIIRFGERGVFR